MNKDSPITKHTLPFIEHTVYIKFTEHHLHYISFCTIGKICNLEIRLFEIGLLPPCPPKWERMNAKTSS